MYTDYPPTLPRPATVTPVDVKMAKHQMRVEAMRQRAVLYRQYASGEQSGVMLRDSFLANCLLPQGAVIAGYWPVADELDIRPLLNALSDRGHPMAMPVVMTRQQPMRFRRWTPGMIMAPGKFGIPTPPDSFPEVRPDVVLVPLVAFDRQGFRLGRGSGFYDHTIELLRGTGKVLCIGIGFSGQEVTAVPHDSFDQRLDWVATEHYAFATQSGFHPLAAFGHLR